MSAQNVLANLNELGVRVWRSGENIRFYPAELVPEPLLDALKVYKADLLGLLSTEGGEGELPPPLSLKAADVPVAVVIGSYNMPSAVELQIRLVRHHCGPDTPILIADDNSDGMMDRTGDTAYDRLEWLQHRYPNVVMWPSVQRVGHSGGDLSALWKGLQWAKATQVKVLAKLSQRFMIDRTNWLQDGARLLAESGRPLASNACMSTGFPLRTEAMLLDVAAWTQPGLIADLCPRPITIAAEQALIEEVWTKLGGTFMVWELLGLGRAVWHPDTYWHEVTSLGEYHNLADKHRMPLREDFHVEPWRSRPGYIGG